MKFNNEISPLNEILSGVPQGSILGPVLYLLFTADLPMHAETITATYADDTALLSVHEDPAIASAKLQAHVHKVEEWLDKWRIKANQGKSVHVTFTLRRQTCPPIKLHNEDIPQAEDAKFWVCIWMKTHLEKAHLDQTQTTGYEPQINILVDRL